MELTAVQIERVKDYIDRKNVKYFDVKIELVDHLSHMIEERMGREPVTFERALSEAYHSFDDKGFKKLVKEKELEFYNHWSRAFNQHIRAYFTLPKVILTILLFVLIHQLSSMIGLGVKGKGGVFYGIYLVVIIVNYVVVRKDMNLMMIKTYYGSVNVKFMIFGNGLAAGLNQFLKDAVHLDVLNYMWSFLLALLIIMCHVIAVEIPDKLIKKKLEEYRKLQVA